MKGGATTEAVILVEASLDDLNPEIAGFVQERALEQGALDAYCTPLLMKKSRPGVLLTILARPAQRASMVELLLRETTTLGVRVLAAERVVLPRRLQAVETRYGTIRMKVAAAADDGAHAGRREWNAAPEYEDCRQAALRCRAPLKIVYREALRVWAARRDASPAAGGDGTRAPRVRRGAPGPASGARARR